MSDIAIGKDIDSYCGKCKLVLAHTIETVVDGKVKRVHCNTCQAQHIYRPNPPGTRKKAASSRTSPSAPPTTPAEYEELLKKYDTARAKPYAPASQFGERDLLKHSVFGIGIVTVRRGDKIDVLFADRTRTLVHQR